MVVASVRVLVPEENRLELTQTLGSLLSTIRNQKGCLSSHFYFEVGHEDTLCLIEEWETQADLDNHLRSNDFAILLGAVNLLKGPSEIEFKLLTPTAGIEAVDAARGKSDPKAPT
jgi:quinol monooxygenase YgiN